MDQRFNQQKYLIRKQFFKFLGASFRIYDQNEQTLYFFVEQKAFKLKEDIRVYSDESKQEEVLIIKARNIIDFSPIFDVYDSKTNQKIGSLQRKGIKSILKDQWNVLNTNDQETAQIHEDSALLATLRRFLSSLIPQVYHAYIEGKMVWEFRQDLNPFLGKIYLDMSHDTEDKMDNRIGIAAAVLLCAIEGQQS